MTVTVDAGGLVVDNGNVDVNNGDLNVNNGNFAVSGTATATSHDVWSDRRLKDNINQLSSPLERIGRIRGVSTCMFMRGYMSLAANNTFIYRAKCFQPYLIYSCY